MTPINGGVPGVPSNLRLPSNHRSLHGHFHGFPMKETVTFCWVPPMAMWSSPPRRRPRLNRTVASTSITCLLRWTWEKLGPGFSRCCTGKDMGLSTTRDTPRWWVYRRESMRMPLNGWFEGTPMTQETSCQMGNDGIYIYSVGKTMPIHDIIWGWFITKGVDDATGKIAGRSTRWYGFFQQI